VQVQALGNPWAAQAQVVKAIKAEMLHQQDHLTPSMLQAEEVAQELLDSTLFLKLKLWVVMVAQVLHQLFLGQL
jgi:hypothetical protein